MFENIYYNLYERCTCGHLYEIHKPQCTYTFINGTKCNCNKKIEKKND